MSETPRTDAVISQCRTSADTGSFTALVVLAKELEFELERAVADLAACRGVADGLREDAERYRWLRDSNKHTHYGYSHVSGSTPSQRLLMALNDDPRYFECITSEIPLAHVPTDGEPIWIDGKHFDFAANMNAAIDAAIKEQSHD